MVWAELHQDLLSTIAKKLNLYEDFKAFGGVCRSWRSVAIKKNFCPVQVPWLLLPPAEDGDDNNRCDLYSLTKRGMVHKVHLPEAEGKKILTSLGWLIIMEKDGGDMELLHPLSRARISLPSASEYEHFRSLGHAALSASPSDTDDYALMIVIGSLLAYWKPGNTAWVTIENGRFSFEGMGYLCGQFYTMNPRGEIFSIDIEGPDPSTIPNIVGTIPWGVLVEARGFFLAECDGHLLVVVRKLTRAPYPAPFYDSRIYDICGMKQPTYFQVYRFESSNNNWHLMNDLGGRSLFLSNIQRCAVSVPCAVGATIRPDCIYFTDVISTHFTLRGTQSTDMAVYSLKERTDDTFYTGGCCSICDTLWVIPSF